MAITHKVRLGRLNDFFDIERFTLVVHPYTLVGESALKLLGFMELHLTILYFDDPDV